MSRAIASVLIVLLGAGVALDSDTPAVRTDAYGDPLPAADLQHCIEQAFAGDSVVGDYDFLDRKLADEAGKIAEVPDHRGAGPAFK